MRQILPICIGLFFVSQSSFGGKLSHDEWTNLKEKSCQEVAEILKFKTLEPMFSPMKGACVSGPRIAPDGCYICGSDMGPVPMCDVEGVDGPVQVCEP